MTKLIPGFNDYCINTEGVVFHIVETKNGMALKELKSYVCNGHNCIKIRGKKFYISCLVLETFVGPRPDRHLIFHKNKDKFDDRITNLVYLTPDKIQLYSTYTSSALERIFAE